MSKGMPAGDGDWLNDYVRRLIDAEFGKDEGKGRPSIAFAPGVGTLSLPAPPPQLLAPPTGQPVPMGFGVVVAGGVALAAVAADMGLEVLHRTAVQRELAVLASDFAQTAVELEPAPQPQKKALGLRTRRKPPNPDVRHKVYGWTRARHRNAS